MLKREEGFLKAEDEDAFLAEMEDRTDEEVIEDAKAPFRYVWWSRKKKRFTTFCEGDITLVTYDNDEDVEEYLATLRTFYKNDQIGRM